mmetsp:Transcript_104036/g.299470  ORF Transcript_104036/g.299470 Transcript_104036/m.299470 type:complete len:469 (-) Transcript_104036:796-2202(-)
MSGHDVHSRRAMNADALSDLAQGRELLLNLVPAVRPVAPKDRGDAAMREQEGVGTADLVVVSELAADDSQVGRVMVLDEGHAAHRVQAHDAGQLAAATEPGEVVAVDGVLKRVVHRKVVDGHDTLRGVDVVSEHLHVAVPILRDRIGMADGANILLLEPCTVAEHEVQPDGSEAHILHEPFDEGLTIILDLLVRVVDVRRVLDVLARRRRALACARGVVVADGPRLPIGVLEGCPFAVAVLLRGAAVVDDDVCHRRDAGVVHILDEAPEVLVATVLRVQVVPIAGQVAAVVDTSGRRGEPAHVDARLLKLRHSALKDLVPAALVVATVPVEALQHDVRLDIAHARGLQLRPCLAHDRVAARALVHLVVDREERVGSLFPQLLHELRLRLAPGHGAVGQVDRGDLVKELRALRHILVLPIHDIFVLAGLDVAGDHGAHKLSGGGVAVGERAPDVVGGDGRAAQVERRLP